MKQPERGKWMGRKRVLGIVVAGVAVTVSLWAGLGSAKAQPKAAFSSEASCVSRPIALAAIWSTVVPKK